MATPSNQSVIKAFALLQAFHRTDEWLTSSELSRRARLPEASGYRLVRTLECIGAVVRDGRGRYRLGMLLLSLSEAIVVGELWDKVPQNLLDELAADLDASVQVGVLEESMVTHVARSGKPRPGLSTGVGTQFEAYSTAMGKVLLASLAPEALDAFLGEGELIALTEHTITDADRLRASLARVKVDDFAVDDRETLETLGCLAVPIRDRSGRTVAAISASDDVKRMDAARRGRMREALQATATAVTDRLFPRQVTFGQRQIKVSACGTRW